MATETKPLTGKIILVIDDGPEFREIYRMTLENAGATVILAENGEEGIAQFQANKVHAVLFDIMMPKMNGYEFMRRLKDFPSAQHIPLIALTSMDAHPEYVEKSTGIEPTDYLIKANTSSEELVKKVLEHLGK